VGFADSRVLFNLWQYQDKEKESQYHMSTSGELIQTERSMLHDANSKTVKVRSVMFQVRFEGADHLTPSGLGEHSFKSNFFIGNDQSTWKTGVRNFREIVYADLYDNVDLVYSVLNDRLKYEFIVHSYSDPNAIRLAYEGVEALSLDDEGNLIISTALGDLLDTAPYIYQMKNGEELPVAGQYVLFNSNTVGFAVEDYDVTLPLIIDPELRYSTFVGGSGIMGSATEYGRAIVVDANGDAYCTGHTKSVDFPTTVGANDTTFNGGSDVFVFKLNSDGSTLLYSTFVGGGSNDGPYDVVVDAGGNVYVTGDTSSSNFPITAGVYDTSFNGMADAFVLKLNSDGSTLLYSTFVGSGGSENGRAIALDTDGNTYVTGETSSPGFPTTAGAYDTSYSGAWDGFMFKLTSSGSALVYSTFIGGSSGDAGLSIALDSSNNTYITGQTTSSDFPTTASAYDTLFNGGTDGFVLKLNPAGTTPLISTFIGGTSSEYRLEVAVDTIGNMYVSGDTSSSDFPTTVGAYDASHNGGLDAFVFKLNYTGSTLDYSTFIGRVNNEFGRDITIDLKGNAYVTGDTDSSDFPTTANAYDTSINGGRDVFIIKLNSAGSMLLYSTFIGGTLTEYGSSITLDDNLNIYVLGHTLSSDFPTTAGAYDISYNGGYDPFVLKLNISLAPTLMITGADTAPAVVTKGQLNVSMERMTFAAVDGDFTLTGLNVNLTGSGDDADISTVRLFDDVNDNNALDGVDVQLSQGSYAGKTILFPLNFPIANNTIERMLVIYDFSSAATSGETCGAIVEYASVTAIGGAIEPFSPIQSINSLINTLPLTSNLGVDGVYIQPIRVSAPVNNLNWTYNDVDGHSQVQYEVYVGTTSGSSDMWDSGSQTSSANTIVYGGAPLSTCASYYFEVHVNDSYEWGDWSEVPFRVNSPPGTPQTPTDPLDGALVPFVDGPFQTVSWSAAFDCDADMLQYTYEIKENATVIVTGTTNGLISIGFDTNSSSTYHVNVTANDGIATSLALYWSFNTTASEPPDTEPPNIIYLVSPSMQEVSGRVNITSTVTDNVEVSGVWIQIFYPDGSELENISMESMGSTCDYWHERAYSVVGTFGYSIWANDTSDNWASESGNFVIQDTTPPDADAGNNRSLYVGDITYLDASNSGDNIGIVNYTWNVSLDGSLVVTLYGENQSISFDEAGTYQVELTVKDASGNIDRDTMTITVSENPLDGPSESQQDYWWIIVIVVIVVIVVILMLLFMRKRRRNEEEIDAE
jgi:hypothetical protein